MFKKSLLGSLTLGFSLCGLTFASIQNWKPSLIIGLISSTATYAGSQYLDKRRHQFLKPTEAIDSSNNVDEIAVFWDYENVRISPESINLIDNFLQEKGYTGLKKVYANWTKENQAIAKSLCLSGFESINVVVDKANATDFKLTADCITYAQENPNIKQIFLLTTDKDYLTLINFLRNSGKKVTLVGREETINNELRAIANEFISIDTIIPTKKTISYEEAINCLIEAIKTAQRLNKKTYFGTIDRLMRNNSSFSYQGVISIQKTQEKKFSSFKSFVLASQKEGKVQLQTQEGSEQPELFLFNQITYKHWLIIIKQVEKAFEEEKNKAKFGRFMNLLSYVRQAQASGQLPYSNKRLHQALNRLIELNILVEQPDKSFRLVDNLEFNLSEDTLKKLMQ